MAGFVASEPECNKQHDPKSRAHTEEHKGQGVDLLPLLPLSDLVQVMISTSQWQRKYAGAVGQSHTAALG